MADNQDISGRIDTLAREVLTLSRNTLMVNLRFMDAALSLLTPMPGQGTLATDGTALFYDARHVLKRYRAEREASVRDYLHVILHCVFRHMYVHTLVDTTLWDLACDIAVEYTITGLNLHSAAAAREQEQQAVFASLQNCVKHMTAEVLYRYYLDRGISAQELAHLQSIFAADDHSIWHRAPDLQSLSSDSQDSNQAPADLQDSPVSTEENESAEQRWKDISERIAMDMETFSKQQGDRAGGLVQNLKEVNRERYDYTSFLKKFAVRTEVMKVNDDEFDYIFYTYGLQLYKKVPLIEPLEYKEAKRIREFVIAIDTSGSTSGELVQKFVQKTYNILKSTETFASKINLHIIQCDAEIQEDAKITSQDEFDAYLKHMQIRGIGGTDFRPVFAYVDKLLAEREFTNLKGLIYFTDGYGTFPNRKPDYETAFVFVDDEYNTPEVPPWAIRLVLQRDEI